MAEDGALHVVLGATGHVGSAVASALLERGRRVRVLTRSAAKAREWASRGAEATVGDLTEPAVLQAALDTRGPLRVFALNPPGPVRQDPDVVETATATAIVEALAGARVERVVALSTYGAREGHRIGDLGTLHRFEQLLSRLGAPVVVLRAGYLLSNWDGAIASARKGVLPVMLDPHRPLPVVDPADVGGEAARLLVAATVRRGALHCEGPERRTPASVAGAFSAVLGRSVGVERTPPERWRSEFLRAGFSPEAAASFVGMNRLVDQEEWRLDAAPVRGATTVERYLERLVADGGPSCSDA